MENCVFCKIRKGEIPSTKLYEDEDFMIIKDINPVAKIHLIAIPNEHYSSLERQTEEGARVLGKILNKIGGLADRVGLDNGYRLVINQGEDAGQTVRHLHIHIIGGEKLKNM